MNKRRRQVDKLTVAKFIGWNCEKNKMVHITLKRGESMEFETYCTTEEGWDASRDYYYNNGYEVEKIENGDGVDCDGRLSHYAEYVCPIKDLHSSTNYHGKVVPLWQDVNSYQRDYSAERMGY